MSSASLEWPVGIQIAITAERMCKTPFLHQGRMPGPRGGLDCVGLLICVAQQLGLKHEDFRAYGREADGAKLKEMLQKCCVELKPEEATTGDIVVFYGMIRNRPMHAAVLSTKRGWIVHAHARRSGGTVRLDPLKGALAKRVHSYWRYVA